MTAAERPVFDDTPTTAEAEIHQQLIELLGEKMALARRDAVAQGKADISRRDGHAKAHGLVKFEFTVEPDLAEDLRVGVFQAGAHYRGWARYSNADAYLRRDGKKDLRGLALKLMNVPGEKIKLADGNQSSCDFLLISAPFFTNRNIFDFFELAWRVQKSKLRFYLYLLAHPKMLFSLVRAAKIPGDLLATRFWSAVPFQFGQRAVKYSLIPHYQSDAKPDFQNPDYLGQRLAEVLRERAVSFDFCVQFQTDLDTMPIDDALVEWRETDSPFIKLATLTMPQQDVNEPWRDSYGENLSFTPWHCPPEQRPLGSINRARKVVYEALSKLRHQHNDEPRSEPLDWPEP